MSLSLRHVTLAVFVVALAALAALTRYTSACASNNGSIGIGAPCQSINDCNTPLQCLPIGADGGCVSDNAMTCQRVCSGPADCEITGLNDVCSEPYACLTAPNSEICIPANQAP